MPPGPLFIYLYGGGVREYKPKRQYNLLPRANNHITLCAATVGVANLSRYSKAYISRQSQSTIEPRCPCT